MIILKEGERYRLTRQRVGGHDQVVKESLPGARHLRSLNPVMDELRAASERGLLVYPEYLDERWRAGRLVRVRLVYRYVPGRTLAEALDGETLLPEGRLHPLLLAAAELLAELAKLQLSLRDFSQGNLIVTPEDRLVLVDLESMRAGEPAPALQARALTRLRLPWAVLEHLRQAYNARAETPVSRSQLLLTYYLREPLRNFNQSGWWRRLRG